MHQNLLFYFDETNTDLKTLKVIIPLDIATKKQLIDALKGALFFQNILGIIGMRLKSVYAIFLG